MDTGRLPPFGPTIINWGARSWPGEARWKLKVRILVFAHKFRSDNKKRFSVQNLKLRNGVHSCFSSWNETFLTLGGTVFLGGKAPKCTPVAPKQFDQPNKCRLYKNTRIYKYYYDSSLFNVFVSNKTKSSQANCYFLSLSIKNF